MSVPVYVAPGGMSAHLVAWGRGLDTGWMGLVTWTQAVTRGDTSSEVDVAAWVPADRLTRPHWSGATTADLPRVDLTSGYPAPPGWARLFLGLWTDGPLPLPAGVQVDRLPAWRR